MAARWASYMEEFPAARLFLPTGDTPRPLYSRSAQTIDFSRAEVFLLDEFILPIDDPALCRAVFQRDFLAGLTGSPAAVHTFDAEAQEPDDECRRIEELVDKGGLDLTLLGIGGNGHLGLNEPGSAADSPTRVVRLASSTAAAAGRYGSRRKPEWGTTLGMRPILDSREIWLLVTGSHKADILDRMLNGPISHDLPATYLRNHPNTVVFTDTSAAGQIIAPPIGGSGPVTK